MNYRESITRGAQAEARFFHMCRAAGLRVKISTPYDNRVKHIDFYVNRTNVEVKAIKSRRRGWRPDPTVVFVELRNVSGGPGWLYGHADFVAFEQPQGFLIVNVEELKILVKRMRSKCSWSNISGVPYTLYGRRQRRDLVMVLAREDMTCLQGTFLLTL